MNVLRKTSLLEFTSNPGVNCIQNITFPNKPEWHGF